MVSSDRDVRTAREYLDTIRSQSVSALPPSVLVREDAELRRLLRLVLDVVDDYEPTAIDEEVTQPTLPGGIHIAAADALTVLSALIEAPDCGEQHDPKSGSLARSAAYRKLAAQIGGQQ